ncbi:MAG: SHOCT domain-containing protein [Chloroflexi bacterium]|nr:SHOCT domain-containing protein [Chloroflexota bacterium]
MKPNVDTEPRLPINSQVSEHYLSDYRKTHKALIQEGENVNWAGNYSHFSVWGENDYYFGYIIITNRRFIKVRYESHLRTGDGCFLFMAILLSLLSGGLISPSGSKPGRPYVDASFHGDRLHYGLIFSRPTYPLRTYETEHRLETENPLANLVGIRREIYELTHQNLSLVKLNLTFLPDVRLGFVLYGQTAGDEAYSIFQQYLRQPERSGEPSIDIADQLEKLAELYKYQTITEEEYEAAKARLFRNDNKLMSS